MAKALDIAKLIYEETDGMELKNLAKRNPYCAEWALVSDKKMDEMIDAKFSQKKLPLTINLWGGRILELC